MEQITNERFRKLHTQLVGKDVVWINANNMVRRGKAVDMIWDDNGAVRVVIDHIGTAGQQYRACPTVDRVGVE